MLSKDAQWYVENIDQISAFEKWIELVKSDLPKQISNWLKEAADAAVRELESKGEPDAIGYSVFPRSQDSDGYEVYWSLRGSWDDAKEIGAFISAWLPKDIDWLTSKKGGDPPVLGLYYFGGPRAKTDQVGQKILEAIKSVPRELGNKIGRRNEYNYFICVDRFLEEDLNPSALREPKGLDKLTKLFKEFTEVMRPGLKSALTK